MAVAANNSLNDISLSDLGKDWQEILECPVCMELLSPPKTLACGHSLCGKCANDLMNPPQGTIFSTITCPTCRKKYKLSPKGLPVNYVLQDLILFGVQKNKKDSAINLYICCLCLKEDSADGIWSCQTCKSMLLCGNCACENHRDHEIIRLSKIIDNQKQLLNVWKDRVNENIVVMKFETENLHKTAVKTHAKLNHMTKSFLTQANEFHKSLDSLIEDRIIEENLLDIQPFLLQKERILNDLKKKHKKIICLNTGGKDVFESKQRSRKMKGSHESMHKSRYRPTIAQNEPISRGFSFSPSLSWLFDANPDD